MEIITDAGLVPGRFQRSVVTIGNFDGVHVGHQALLAEVRRRARDLGGPAVAYTFDPHPLRVLDPSICPPSLTDFEQKTELIAALGVDVLVRARFDREYAARPPEWFAGEVLGRALGAAEIWAGPDFAFGQGRRGNAAFLRAQGERWGYTVASLPAFVVDGDRVSSTRVREAVRAKDFAGAGRLLGRPYALHGPVAHGFSRGRDLGFPTANCVPREECIPPAGVYAAWAEVEGLRHPAAVNVGTNPTFAQPGAPPLLTVEAHLLDGPRDLYGRQIRIVFVEAIRGEIAFSGAGALIAQIGRDVEKAKKILSLPISVGAAP